MDKVNALKIKIFADGANIADIKALYQRPYIKGFTTNPTLMRKAGVADYAAFAAEVLKVVPDRPVSFEVFADDFPSMEAQAMEIASWGKNVNVKIPITNTKGESSGPLIKRLSARGVQLNVTAMLTLDQVRIVADALAPETPAIVSVFAGRVADTGRDPVPLMKEALSILKKRPKAELLWASPRELLNIFQGEEIGCHIITVTPDVLGKLGTVGRDLADYSLDTVKMFHKDATAAGFAIKTGAEVAGRRAAGGRG
jgi:transaldolase